MVTDQAANDRLAHCNPWSARYRGVAWDRALYLAATPECIADRIVTHLTASSGRAEGRVYVMEHGVLTDILMTDESAPDLNSHVSIRLKVEGRKIVDGISDRDGRVQVHLRLGQLRALRGLLYEGVTSQTQCGRPFESLAQGDRLTLRTDPLHNLHEDAIR